jgi:hypothetical protein
MGNSNAKDYGGLEGGERPEMKSEAAFEIGLEKRTVGNKKETL